MKDMNYGFFVMSSLFQMVTDIWKTAYHYVLCAMSMLVHLSLSNIEDSPMMNFEIMLCLFFIFYFSLFPCSFFDAVMDDPSL